MVCIVSDLFCLSDCSESWKCSYERLGSGCNELVISEQKANVCVHICVCEYVCDTMFVMYLWAKKIWWPKFKSQVFRVWRRPRWDVVTTIVCDRVDETSCIKERFRFDSFVVGCRGRDSFSIPLSSPYGPVRRRQDRQIDGRRRPFVLIRCKYFIVITYEPVPFTWTRHQNIILVLWHDDVRNHIICMFWSIILIIVMIWKTIIIPLIFKVCSILFLFLLFSDFNFISFFHLNCGISYRHRCRHLLQNIMLIWLAICQ